MVKSRIEVRIDPDLKQRLDDVVAHVPDTDRSAFVCRAIEYALGGSVSRRAPIRYVHEQAPDPTLRAIHIEDVRQGVNLNQIARAANTGALAPADVQLFMQTLNGMRELFARRDAQMAALGYGTMDGQSSHYDGGGVGANSP